MDIIYIIEKRKVEIKQTNIPFLDFAISSVLCLFIIKLCEAQFANSSFK